MIKKIALTILAGIILSFSTDNREEKEATVRMTISEWSVVLEGVAKLPLERSQGVYMKIITQVQSQLDTIPKKK